MSKIELLPEHLINQIKAGEVVERPSSIIKELIENSIDANSTEIEIEIINNGLDILTIKDNGSGIDKEYLELAFYRHATSKIRNYVDILNLKSFGFRGEALASVASVSKIDCTSKIKNNTASRIIIEGGKTLFLGEVQAQHEGTRITIKDLFYNTPARFEYLKTQSTEKNVIERTINSFIISNPHIKFSLKWDDQRSIIYQPKKSKITRAKEILKSKCKDAPQFEEFKKEYEKFHISLLINKNFKKGIISHSQFIFINNRFVLNKQIHHYIVNTFKDIWLQFQGQYVLFVNLPTHMVDINVHPNKTEVKISKIHTLLSMISSVVEDFKKKNATETTSSLSTSERLTNLFNEKSLKLDYLQDSKKTIINSDSHFRLNKKYTLFSENQKFYLVNSGKCLIHLLPYYSNINEDDFEKISTPLFIAEPFVFSEKKASFFQNLKNHGFDVEPVNETHIILKGIPKTISSLNYIKIFQNYISSYKKELCSDFMNFIKIHDVRFEKTEFSNLLCSPSAESLMDMHAIKEFSVDNLIYSILAVKPDDQEILQQTQ